VDINKRGVADNGHVWEGVESFGDFWVKERLWFCDAHGVMVSPTDDDVDVPWNLREVMCCEFVLLIDIEEVEVLVLAWINTDAFDNISDYEEVAYFFCDVALLFCSVFAVEPLNEFCEIFFEKALDAEVDIADKDRVNFVWRFFEFVGERHVWIKKGIAEEDGVSCGADNPDHLVENKVLRLFYEILFGFCD